MHRKNYIFLFVLFVIHLIVAPVFAKTGRITIIDFAGATEGNHPDVVQLQIEGGFTTAGCSTTFAAIRKEDVHLVSFVITAFATERPISVGLSTGPGYFGSTAAGNKRCVINFVRGVAPGN